MGTHHSVSTHSTPYSQCTFSIRRPFSWRRELVHHKHYWPLQCGQIPKIPLAAILTQQGLWNLVGTTYVLAAMLIHLTMESGAQTAMGSLSGQQGTQGLQKLLGSLISTHRATPWQELPLHPATHQRHHLRLG